MASLTSDQIPISSYWLDTQELYQVKSRTVLTNPLMNLRYQSFLPPPDLWVHVFAERLQESTENLGSLSGTVFPHVLGMRA
jgi:hypothetical protein